jgi:hypothetical protein
VAGFVALKSLLHERHWQTYRMFCAQYDKAARTVDKSLVGSYPSRAQLHRWLHGDLKGLPYAKHCLVLEAMFPGVRASEMFQPSEHGTQASLSEPNLGELVAAGLSAPATELSSWRSDRLAPAEARRLSAARLPASNRTTGGVNPTGHLARSIVLLGKRLRLTELR